MVWEVYANGEPNSMALSFANIEMPRRILPRDGITPTLILLTLFYLLDACIVPQVGKILPSVVRRYLQLDRISQRPLHRSLLHYLT